MQRVTPDRLWPLFDVAAMRDIEHLAAQGLPAHTLMQRAGLALARLALALAPHSRTIWIACGPGNNGGDGLEAAMHLKQWGKDVALTWCGDEQRAPADALASLARARQAGVAFHSAPPASWDLAIDAMLGLGNTRALEGIMADWARTMNAAAAPVLAVDLPSGLHADTGTGDAVQAAHTLSLLALKPGLFTAKGRDAAGQVWLHDLSIITPTSAPSAWLHAPSHSTTGPHDSHKGSYGDVAVIGGAAGMTGAALLAASAALHAGAGRVFACLLCADGPHVDTAQPDLMFRAWDGLDLKSLAVACGCGGGDAVRAVLPRVLSGARDLVLDADALNAIAGDTALQTLLKSRTTRGKPTVLTPHPLEAARLLNIDARAVQQDRLRAARELAERFGCVIVLKGSGTIIAAPQQPHLINPTGNSRLATAGTGDVLAGMIVARMASGAPARQAAADAVHAHGLAADLWPQDHAFTASLLARSLVR